MKKRIKRAAASRAFFPALCYGVTLALWLLAGLLYLVDAGIAYQSGRLPRMELAAAGLTLNNAIAGEDGVLYCTTPDPQLIWNNTDGIMVNAAEMNAQYDKFSGEICLYYINSAEETFSQSKRVFAVKTGENTYRFLLPRGKIAALRLDVCSDTCAVSDFSLTLNVPRPLYSYFVPAWRQLYAFLLYPGLTACALALAVEFWRAYGPNGGAREIKRRV